MAYRNARRIGQVLAIALAWCLWPAAAQAQGYACSGPGPGERVMGQLPGSNGQPGLLLCVRDDNGGPPAPPPAPINRYAGIAWHPDAADVWVDGNYANSAAPGERGALAACTRAMGNGCTSAGGWWNSSTTIIRDKAGYFYRAWAGEGGNEREQVLAECSAKQPLPCEVFATIPASTGKRSPRGDPRKYFVASAWVKGGVSDGYNSKLYVASGYRSGDEATSAAIKACSDATSRACETNALSGNGFIQAYRMNGSEDSATSENSASRAKQAAQVNCKKLKGVTCELQALFDSRKPGLFVHDFAAGKAK